MLMSKQAKWEVTVWWECYGLGSFLWLFRDLSLSLEVLNRYRVHKKNHLFLDFRNHGLDGKVQSLRCLVSIFWFL